ncbi:MAG TPA: hypothetical protein VG714_04855 [Acidobacteriaceae bacterium]|nr:hypothetical protein [Acidobacteriaceae bacterium]
MLQDDFNVRMQELHRAGKREARFSAPLFAELLNEHGGLETARRFIHSPDYAPGFTALWERKRLDLTVEAVIVSEPQWQPLFTPDEIETCRKRLREYGYPNA